MDKHFTATVYIVAKVKGEYRVLLHLHKKLQLWLAIGGHVESNENPIEAVLREAKEETSLEVTLFSPKHNLIKTQAVTELPTPTTILEETIPPYKNQPAHYHVDLIYFGTTKQPNQVQMTEQFGWFSYTELNQLELEEEVEYLAKQALEVKLKF